MGIFSVVLGEHCEFLGRGKMKQIYLKNIPYLLDNVQRT